MKGIIKATGEKAAFMEITTISDPIWEPGLPPGTILKFYALVDAGRWTGMLYSEKDVTITEE